MKKWVFAPRGGGKGAMITRVTWVIGQEQRDAKILKRRIVNGMWSLLWTGQRMGGWIDKKKRKLSPSATNLIGQRMKKKVQKTKQKR